MISYRTTIQSVQTLCPPFKRHRKEALKASGYLGSQQHEHYSRYYHYREYHIPS